MNDAALFWTAVQSIGTILAAIAAIIALMIAGRQLGELIASNKLLAESNKAMTESNVSLTRPLVVVDFEFKSSVDRKGGTFGHSVFVVVRNDGKSTAHNLTMTVDSPFAPVSEPSTEGWRKSLEDLNRIMDGNTVLRSLTNTRPLRYYLDGTELFGVADELAPSWRVEIQYENSSGRIFKDSFALEVEPWRRVVVLADPLARIGKFVDSVAHEVKALNATVKAKN